MAVTAQESAQLANTTAVRETHNPTHDWHGRLRLARFTFTQSGAGDADSTAALVRLPAGSVRVLLAESRVANSAFGASRTLDLGWQAHTDRSGAAVAADDDGLDAAQDVATAGAYSPIGTVGGDETRLFQSQAGVVIEAKVAGGTIPDGATLNGYLVYVQD